MQHCVLMSLRQCVASWCVNDGASTLTVLRWWWRTCSVFEWGVLYRVWHRGASNFESRMCLRYDQLWFKLCSVWWESSWTWSVLYPLAGPDSAIPGWHTAASTPHSAVVGSEYVDDWRLTEANSWGLVGGVMGGEKWLWPNSINQFGISRQYLINSISLFMLFWNCGHANNWSNWCNNGWGDQTFWWPYAVLQENVKQLGTKLVCN